MFAAATVAVLLLFSATTAEAAKKIVKRGAPVISDIPQNRSVSRTSTCGIDLMLIADGSGDVANDVFEKERQFLLTILDGLNIGRDATRVGVSLASEPKDRHSYDYDKNPDLAKSLPNILLGACHASNREAAEHVGSG